MSQPCSEWIAVSPKRAQLRPVVVHDPTFGETLPRFAERPQISEAVRWKCFNWNAAMGLCTMLLISAAGWAGLTALVSSLLEH